MREASKHRRSDAFTITIACMCVGISFVILFAFFVLVRFGVIGPDWRYYRGDYPELFTVAINSLLDSRGYQVYSLPLPARIRVIETDDFGRVLFFYSEIHPMMGSITISAFSLLISQHSNGEYVYFYPHHNFISVGHMYHFPQSGFVPNISQLAEDFTMEAIAELKEKNSWNRELYLDNAIRAEIVHIKKDHNGPVDRDTLLSVGVDIFGLGEDEHRNPFFHFFIADAYGRSIYVVRGASVGDRRTFVVLFQPDGSFDIDISVMELLDLQRYQDELKALKKRNGWNQPFS